ncbi:MAG: ATP-binding protein [Intestinibacter bartlettii]|uniref:HAMP domain-containing sensor histidine kinase n=1 Tax=Intestinibacter bartlettii TaxID=261299 RepID=UPI0026EDF57F|nr:HAMP domain-containing sensor histidine kinase [Intestinibacter bartlettii]MDO5010994.1 ATP-binding protein [Intestinibacter bartlettii]
MKVSKDISNKQFDSRVRGQMSGEMGQFAKNFNSMIDTINFTIKDITYKNTQLKSIMQSVSHGILAIDTKGKILLINDLAKTMVEGDEQLVPEGKTIRQFIKNKVVLESIIYNMSGENTTIVQKNISKDIIYKIKIDPVHFEDTDAVIGFIINIENVTEYVKLENMRKEFVANVSHELKTPITSIKGFVETLKMTDNLDDNTKNRFLTIIENEATRLTRLVDDILLLSTIENKTRKKVEKVDLFEVFEEVHEVVNYIAKKKNIKLKYQFENEDIDLWEYSGYVRQILLNIISNAIKYTGENGKVNIKQYVKGGNVFIEVQDNGIGIPEEDINRIFERFYRVDKARSRSVGGTGLGLAITKHMVKALNGNIRVESELGVGSKFIIELPFNTELAKKVS